MNTVSASRDTSAVSLPIVPFGFVQKRDGSRVTWDGKRVIRAIALAIYDARNSGRANPSRFQFEERYGLTAQDFDTACGLAARVIDRLIARHGIASLPSVEEIQSQIEVAVFESGLLDVARAFIVYRQQQAEKRPIVHTDNGLQDYIAVSRYCRYSPELKRRETWKEAVARVRDMHLRRFDAKIAAATPARVAEVIRDLVTQGVIEESTLNDLGDFGGLGDEINKAFGLVAEKKVLPSMRSLQFGGAAIEAHNERMFNCAFTLIDRTSAFREYFYLLLCGCGVGFSVQKCHVAHLPELAARTQEIDLDPENFHIPDSIEGWADAIDKLMGAYFNGYSVLFDYSNIRRRAAVLKTSGGRAPGPKPLKNALEKIEAILGRAAGRRLKPIEVYDILMHAAKAVLSGGIRRSATIALFSCDDEDMMNAKTGDWGKENEQRTASNNSAVLIRDQVTREQFDRIFHAQKQYGEPGFYFSDNADFGSNPCVEIGLNPVLTVTQRELTKLQQYGFKGAVQLGDRLTGTQMCNLTTVAGSAAATPKAFFGLVRNAALIGTVQADYTDMPYLGAVTRVINEREALIGVSICGILDNPDVLLDAASLRRGAAVVKATNAIIATLIGINRAARTTCVKPEGTSSLVLNSASGIHAHPSRRYIRHVQASTADTVFKFFREQNEHMTEMSVYDPNRATAVIAFPVEGPANGIYQDDLTALRFLELVKRVQKNWVMPGRSHTIYSEVEHNVSNTTIVGPDEWDAVADFIFENRHSFTGVALLPKTGDKVYQQAPRMSVTTEEDVRRWNRLLYRPIDWSKMPDEQDVTAGSAHRGAAVACGGGSCELHL